MNILNNTAFNFLRKIEEHLNENIGLTINGSKVENLSKELKSGTLFGECLIWTEKESKFGKTEC